MRFAQTVESLASVDPFFGRNRCARFAEVQVSQDFLHQVLTSDGPGQDWVTMEHMQIKVIEIYDES